MASLIEPLHSDLGDLGQPSPERIANKIIELEELPLFVRQHSGNKLPFVDAELIRYHFDVSWNRAEQARNLLSAHITQEEMERFAEEEWDSSSS